MKRILILLFIIGSFSLVAQSHNIKKYYHHLTIPGMCDQGRRLNQHRANCLQWLIINYTTGHAQIMITDMPILGKVTAIKNNVVSLYFKDLNKKFGFMLIKDDLRDIVSQKKWTQGIIR